MWRLNSVKIYTFHWYINLRLIIMCYNKFVDDVVDVVVFNVYVERAKIATHTHTNTHINFDEHFFYPFDETPRFFSRTFPLRRNFNHVNNGKGHVHIITIRLIHVYLLKSRKVNGQFKYIFCCC